MKPSCALLAAALVIGTSVPLAGQGGRPQNPLRRQAVQLDSEGKTAEARVLIQQMIDSAPDPAAKAAGQRLMAMSYGFDGDCANALKYEQMVIAYWVTREQAEPQNAFYQQGEMANEAARVCIDAGDLDTAEKWYREGERLGNREPEPRTHPKSLWDFRTAHALARVAARRGNKSEAERQVLLARQALDSDSAMARGQERYFPYLVGYVALYTGDLAKAEAQLSSSISMDGNDDDPFQHYLLALTYEKQGKAEQSRAMYQKAYDMASGHNPPAAFTRPAARKKLAAP